VKQNKCCNYFFALWAILQSNCSLFAFSPIQANTILNSFTSAFYTANGTNAYFKKSQADHRPADFWEQAEMIECVIDAYDSTTNAAYQKMVSNLLNGFIRKNGSNWTSWNIYNDDIMWAVIAFARGGVACGNTNYCHLARANFDACYARAWDGRLGGGFYWDTDNASKNACANGPAAIAAYLLYEIYGDPDYLKKSANLFNWERLALFNTNTGAVYDNLGTNGTLHRWTSTYNQGTFIGAANFLGHTNDAKLAAEFTFRRLTTGGILPRYGIAGNNSGFNAIFLRWLALFSQSRNLQKLYEPRLLVNATAAWNARRADGLSWCQWPEPSPGGTNLCAWDCISSFEVMLTADQTRNVQPPPATH